MKFTPVQSSYNFSEPLGDLKMGSLQIIVVKLHSYKDSDVGNLHKFEYFYKYFRHLRNA